MDNLLRCPICLRKPKLKYELYPTGTFVTIKCKPLFKKPHLEVTQGKAGGVIRATTSAVREWNCMVVRYMVERGMRIDLKEVVGDDNG